jgi:transmembrane sensor
MRITASDMRWTAGMLSFEDKPVSLVIATANRYSDVQIVLADPSLGELRFTGTVKAKDTLGLARMIAAMFKLRLDTTDPQRLVLSR